MDHAISVAQRYMNICESYLSLNERYSELDQSHADLQRKFYRLFNTYELVAHERATLEQQLLNWNQEIEALKQTLKDRESQLDRMLWEHDQAMATHQTQVGTIQLELADAQGVLSALQVDNANLTQQLNRMAELEAELSRLLSQLEVISRDKLAAEERASLAERTVTERETQLADLRSQLEQKQAELDSMTSRYHAMLVLEEFELLLSDSAMELLEQTENAVTADRQLLADNQDAELAEATALINTYPQFEQRLAAPSA